MVGERPLERRDITGRLHHYARSHMRTPEDHHKNSKTDALPERQQRTQKERSDQALSNLGSQDRKRAPSNTRHDPLHERGDGEK